MQTIAYGEHPDQVLDLRDGSDPLVVLLHGGFWRRPYARDLMTPLAEAFAAEGRATANVEYRRLGPGSYRAMLDDVLAARQSLGKRRAVAVGHSAGGHLALWLAAKGAVDSAVALGSVCDLTAAAREHLGRDAAQEFLGGEPEAVSEAYDEADPARRLPLGVRHVLVHGTADDVVPIDHARAYAARAGDECRIVELDDLDHMDVIDPRSAAWPVILECV
ncbi:MAG: hypothetical protein QOF43_2050 [Gaiellaceae bacterium]|nr:hypothetical protein [Gaiellaceae bacterium]